MALVLAQAQPADSAGVGEAAPAGEASPAPAEPAPGDQPPARTERRATNPAGAPERPAAQPRPAEPERAQVARATLAFLDVLLAGDARGLAAASAERFSFDGEVRTGKEEILRTWRSLLAGRDAAQHPALLDLELLPAADAVSRLGPAPFRLAQLAGARGAWVAVANVSRRPVVLFLAREGSRWAVAGME